MEPVGKAIRLNWDPGRRDPGDFGRLRSVHPADSTDQSGMNTECTSHVFNKSIRIAVNYSADLQKLGAPSSHGGGRWFDPSTAHHGPPPGGGFLFVEGFHQSGSLRDVVVLCTPSDPFGLTSLDRSSRLHFNPCPRLYVKRRGGRWRPVAIKGRSNIKANRGARDPWKGHDQMP